MLHGRFGRRHRPDPLAAVGCNAAPAARSAPHAAMNLGAGKDALIDHSRYA
jgi:hypothetical protein